MVGESQKFSFVSPPPEVGSLNEICSVWLSYELSQRGDELLPLSNFLRGACKYMEIIHPVVI